MLCVCVWVCVCVCVGGSSTDQRCNKQRHKIVFKRKEEALVCRQPNTPATGYWCLFSCEYETLYTQDQTKINGLIIGQKNTALSGL